MVYICIIIGIFAAEYFIKEYVEKNFKEGQNEKALKGLVLTTKYHNEGAFLDMGSGKKAIVKWISTVLTLVLTIVFIVTWNNFISRDVSLHLLFASLSG